MMRRAVLLSLLLLSVGVEKASAVDIAAGQLRHMIVRMTEPKRIADKVPAKEYWVQSDTVGRMQEVQPKHSEHQRIVIVNTPNLYDYDMFDKKAVQVTNSKKKATFTIFGKGYRIADDPKNEENGKTLMDLRFGNEMEFFKAHSAKKTDSKDAKGAPIHEYSIPLGKESVVLATNAKDVPQSVTLKYADKIMALTYEKYENQPKQDSLFTIPKGVTVAKITEEELKAKQAEFQKKVMEKIAELKLQQKAQAEVAKEMNAKELSKGAPKAPAK